MNYMGWVHLQPEVKLASHSAMIDKIERSQQTQYAQPSYTAFHQNLSNSLWHTEALVAATKEIVLEVNAYKTKYMIVSRNQNAGRIHSMKVDNSSIERVEELKYLGTTLTNQNSIQEEIKSRLK